MRLARMALILSTACIPALAAAQAGSPNSSTMVEDSDGTLQRNEYETVSMNDSITRALCPYTCEMRGLPKQSCRTWQSQNDPSLCYVQDTRIPSNAIALGGGENEAPRSDSVR